MDAVFSWTGQELTMGWKLFNCMMKLGLPNITTNNVLTCYVPCEGSMGKGDCDVQDDGSLTENELKRGKYITAKKKQGEVYWDTFSVSTDASGLPSSVM